jgi:predicted GNAT family acetyltransferase
VPSPTPGDRTPDQRLQQYVRITAAIGRDTERVGPFLATFDPHDDLKYLSYAIPDDDARPTPDDVAALIAAYGRHERLPRLEFLPSVAPAAEAALLAGGLQVEARLPVMTCDADTVVDLAPDDGIALDRPVTEDDVHGMLAAQMRAFGEPPPDDDAVARAFERLGDGALRVLARDTATGTIVGGGVATTPAGATSEIAGIGVDAAYRRRGIAGAITARLARELFDAGVTTVFLTPGHDGAHRVYARAGFADTTEMVHLSLPGS